MLTSLNALFKISARESMACADSPPSTSYDSEPCLTHVRANLSQQWVSAQDFLHYTNPGMHDTDIQLQINRLPRAARVHAFWPPSKDNAKLKDTEFEAVSFDNLKLLLTGDDATAMEATVDSFIGDMRYTATNPGMYPMCLATDARKTQSQKRFERDVKDRLLKPDKYYNMKRVRDAAFRSRKRAKSSPSLSQEQTVPELCSECGFVLPKHFVWCNHRTANDMIIDSISSSDGQDSCA